MDYTHKARIYTADEIAGIILTMNHDQALDFANRTSQLTGRGIMAQNFEGLARKLPDFAKDEMFRDAFSLLCQSGPSLGDRVDTPQVQHDKEMDRLARAAFGPVLKPAGA